MTFTQAPFASAIRGVRVAYQVKGGRFTDAARTRIFGDTPNNETSQSVPEPTTIFGLLLAGAVVAGLSKTKKAVQQ